MTHHTRHTLCAAFAVLALAGWSGTARAASMFSLPPGAQITDVEFVSSSATLSYDGTAEAFTYSASLAALRFVSAPDLEFNGPGQHVVEFSTTLFATGPLSLIENFLGIGTGSGNYENGVPADFLLTNFGVDGLEAPSVVLAADYQAPGQTMSLSSLPGGVLTGTLIGRYDILAAMSDPTLVAALTPAGEVAVNISGFETPGGTPLTSVCALADAGCPGSGMIDFTAQPTIDLTPDAAVPEPGTLALLGLGLLGCIGRRLRR